MSVWDCDVKSVTVSLSTEDVFSAGVSSSSAGTNISRAHLLEPFATAITFFTGTKYEADNAHALKESIRNSVVPSKKEENTERVLTRNKFEWYSCQ